MDCDCCQKLIEGEHFTPILTWEHPITLHLHWACGSRLLKTMDYHYIDGVVSRPSKIPDWVWETVARAIERVDGYLDDLSALPPGAWAELERFIVSQDVP